MQIIIYIQLNVFKLFTQKICLLNHTLKIVRMRRRIIQSSLNDTIACSHSAKEHVSRDGIETMRRRAPLSPHMRTDAAPEIALRVPSRCVTRARTKQVQTITNYEII